MNDDTTTTTALPSAHEAATAAYADSSSATPETASTPVTTTAAATVQPGATDTPADSASTETQTTETPEPPKWRWQDILENQRQKTAQETEARLKQELGWAMDIPTESRPHISTALQLMQALNANPAQTIALLQQQLGLQGSPDQSMGRPEPDVDAGNGTLLYSAAQMEKLRQWDRQQILDDVNQRFAPYEQERQTRAIEQQRQALVSNVTKQLERMRSRPHFKEHEPDIRSLMLADEQLSLQDAYEQVLLEKVIPSMSKQSESQVLAQMKTRAVQATVNPSGATPTAPASLIGNARAAAEAAYRDA